MKKLVFIPYLCTLLIWATQVRAQKQSYTLAETIKAAKNTSITAKIAESIKDNKYYQYLSYKAGLRPQLSLTGNPIGYSKDFLGVVQPDGNLIFQPRTQNYSSLGLSLSQPISFTGGTIAVNSNLARFDDLDRKEKRYSGIPLNISFSQPLLAFNSYQWDKRIEPLKYQEAEKEYIKEIEQIALATTKLYFNVLDAQADLELSKKNLESQNVIMKIEDKRIELGTTTKEKILQLKLQLLKSTQELSKAEVTLKTSLFNLRSYIGLGPSHEISLAIPDAIPVITIPIETAINAARKNRSEFIAYKRRKLEAERDLQLAKRERFKINLVTSYGYNNIGDNLSAVYNKPNSQQTINLGVQVPILDWGRNKGKISMANSNLKTVTYTIEQEEIVLVQEITYLVENLQLISSNIENAKQADLIAQERFELANEQFRFGKISITDLHIALSEKDTAKRTFITAIRNFWESYYELRALTLLDI